MVTGNGAISVYGARDAKGRFRFVGRTRNLERRAAEDAARGWTVTEIARVDDLNTALGLEQTVLDMARKVATDRAADDK
jgi:hypothetical protein